MDMARKKQMITLTLDPELVERLKKWISWHEFPPAQNAVIAKAIRNFLDADDARFDYWPFVPGSFEDHKNGEPWVPGPCPRCSSDNHNQRENGPPHLGERYIECGDCGLALPIDASDGPDGEPD